MSIFLYIVGALGMIAAVLFAGLWLILPAACVIGMGWICGKVGRMERRSREADDAGPRTRYRHYTAPSRPASDHPADRFLSRSAHDRYAHRRSADGGYGDTIPVPKRPEQNPGAADRRRLNDALRSVGGWAGGAR